MSNRSLVELNHDFCPDRDADLLQWAIKMRLYMTSGDPQHLPRGVTFLKMRHHSDPEFELKEKT